MEREDNLDSYSNAASSPALTQYSTASDGTIHPDLPVMTSSASTATNPTSVSAIPNYASVTPLSVGTFFQWQLRLTTLLGVLKLRRFIETEIPTPTNPLLIYDHMAKECQALNAIHSTIDDENMQVITTCVTAYEAYQALCAHHCGSGGITTAQMFYEMVNLRLAKGGSVSEHIHRFRTLHNCFSSSIKSTPGITISDHFIAILLLMSLPLTYHSLVQTTLATSFEKISLPRVYLILQAETSRLESSASNSDSAMATTAKQSKPITGSNHKSGSGYQGRKPRTDRDDRICSLGHKGHTNDYCRIQIQQKLDESEKRCKELSEKASKSEEKKTSAHCTVTDTQPTYWDDACLTGGGELMDTITLDTAATSMMFGNKELLQSVAKIPPREIGVASKEGTITAHHQGVFNMGGLKVSQVPYSPDIAVNLISAGLLNDSGHDIRWRSTRAVVYGPDEKQLITFHRDPNNA